MAERGVPRSIRKDFATALTALALCAGAATAHAIPLVSLEGGSGLPGGTASAILSLADDPTGSAASADVAVHFPDPPLATDPSACALAARLAATHHLTTSSPLAGEVLLSIAPIAAASLGDGPLASCDFGIALGTPAGTVALALQDLELRNADGDTIAADSADGFITILPSGPTPTASVTVTPTLTFTPTVPPPPTETPTASPTATIFTPIAVADTFSGCSTTSRSSHSDAGWLLLAGASLFALRRRR